MHVNTLYDVTIIGAGPAGMTAAIYASRANKLVNIVDKEGYGGQIARSPRVENIPGFTSISGKDFANNLFDQIMSSDKVAYTDGEAVSIGYTHRIFKVVLADNSVICSKSIIFATGCKPKDLHLNAKNVYYCVTCDGPFFKDKDVLVIGSGNTGATYALELASYCNKVYICDVTPNLMCESILAEKITNAKNITFLAKTGVKQVVEDKGQIVTVVLSDDSGLKVDAIFSAAGQTPETACVSGLAELNEKGYISGKMVPGVFACGDCTDNPVKQVVTACASGAEAALKAVKFVNDNF